MQQADLVLSVLGCAPVSRHDFKVKQTNMINTLLKKIKSSLVNRIDVSLTFDGGSIAGSHYVAFIAACGPQSFVLPPVFIRGGDTLNAPTLVNCISQVEESYGFKTCAFHIDGCSVNLKALEEYTSNASDCPDAGEEEVDMPILAADAVADDDQGRGGRTCEEFVSEINKNGGPLVSRCLLHMVNRVLGLVFTTFDYSPVDSLLDNWAWFMFGDGCAERRARFVTFNDSWLKSKHKTNTAKADLLDAVHDCQRGVREKHYPPKHGMTTIKNLVGDSSGNTFEEVCASAVKIISDMSDNAGQHLQTARQPTNPKGTRFSSRILGLRDLKDWLPQIEEFLVVEGKKFAFVRGGKSYKALCSIFQENRQDTLQEKVDAVWGNLEPLLEILKELQGGGNAKSWQVTVQMEDLLEKLNNRHPAIAGIFSDKWKEIRPLYVAASMFNPYNTMSYTEENISETLRGFPALSRKFSFTEYLSFKTKVAQLRKEKTLDGAPASVWEKLYPDVHDADGNTIVPTIKQIALAFLNIQPTTAKVEGLISRIGNIRIKVMNRISQEHLSRLMVGIAIRDFLHQLIVKETNTTNN